MAAGLFRVASFALVVSRAIANVAGAIVAWFSMRIARRCVRSPILREAGGPLAAIAVAEDDARSPGVGMPEAGL
jgi:hypothetical protein